MDYFNKDSITATQRSYNEALDKLLELCPNIEPSANEYNQRIVTPTSWRPKFGHNEDVLLRHINFITTRFETLFNFGNPKVIDPSYTIWKERWFVVYCAIQFPFKIYGWNYAITTYPKGYDEDGNPIGEPQHIPAMMKEWDTPHYLTLVVYDGAWDKGWGLRDWHIKHDEIANFGKSFGDITTKDKYLKELKKADDEVSKWEQAIRKLQSIVIPK